MEAPELEILLAKQTEFDEWKQHLSMVCSREQMLRLPGLHFRLPGSLSGRLSLDDAVVQDMPPLPGEDEDGNSDAEAAERAMAGVVKFEAADEEEPEEEVLPDNVNRGRGNAEDSAEVVTEEPLFNSPRKSDYRNGLDDPAPGAEIKAL